MSLIIKLRCMTRNLSCNLNQLTVQSRKFEILRPRNLRCFSSKTEESDLEEIHEGGLTKVIKGVKIFSLSTSAATLLIQPFIIPTALQSGGMGAAAGLAVSFGMFAVLTPMFLHIFAGRYVTDIHYDKKRDLYIASTWSIFLRKKKFEFTPKDVEKPGLAQLLTTVLVKGRPMFFILEDFSDLRHYELIMGYDKPMDFGFEKSLENSEPVEEKIKVKKAN
ncbi:transmembrane protein 70 homolog, mitochondrial [Cotesia glomerata]|uniref:Transmembrane protein 70 n=1 Tax=Cotesia glomerata TaxID=32391 RepID=A0AAV7HWA0_COTGL|nr:transmembrane protein 70 homolog, mitochondrial [Cotesia glomerata]KAH0534304.1 hypothetical protein KQX54_002851 [Cotesia glomerata]